MTGTNTWYYPSAEGSSYGAGWMRLKFVETWDDDTNTSSLALSLQAKSTYIGNNWSIQGTISVDGTTLFSDSQYYATTIASDWDDVRYVNSGNVGDVVVKTINNIAHDSEGKKTIKLVVAKADANTSFVIVRSINSQGAWVSLGLDDTAGTDYSLNSNEVGSYTLIAGEKYDILIGNGSSWDKYDVKIGSGSAWENY